MSNRPNIQYNTKRRSGWSRMAAQRRSTEVGQQEQSNTLDEPSLLKDSLKDSLSRRRGVLGCLHSHPALILFGFINPDGLLCSVQSTAYGICLVT